jgi:DNA-binding CsgD family transcriptional regulator
MGEVRAVPAPGEIRVGVVEEDEIVRYGLVAGLAEDPGLHVRAMPAEALDAQPVDIAIVSSEAAAKHLFPCPIVVCGHNARGPSEIAVGNDVVGVLYRTSLTVAQLRATVHAAATGLRVNAHDSSEPTDGLDSRAVRVLELIAQGHSTREIADEMSYSERTIKKLITGVENHMKARSRAHVVAEAIRRGLI